MRVLHSNYVTSSCISFEATGGLNVDTNTVTVGYAEVGEPCDYESPYTLGYELRGLTTEEYSLAIPGGLSGSFMIP